MQTGVMDLLHDMEHDTSALPCLPVPSDWDHEALTGFHSSIPFNTSPVPYADGIPQLPGVVNRYIIGNDASRSELFIAKWKGWQGPGPGPKRGTRRLPLLHDLENPFLLAVLHLARESIYFQQLYCYQSLSSDSCPLNFTESMAVLRQCEIGLPVSAAMKKNIWTLTHRLGVPAFLLKLRSPHHAIAMNFITDRPGNQWWCSYCYMVETATVFNCPQALMMNSIIEDVSRSLGCETDFLMESMVQSAAFHHISDLTQASFYGTKRNHQFALVRHERIDLSSPLTSSSRFHIVKRMNKSQGWKCLSRMCAGYSTKCVHSKTVQDHVDQSLTHCFSNIHEIQDEDLRGAKDGDPSSGVQDDEVPTPRHSRPIIPSENAFKLDYKVNRDARNNVSHLLLAASSCHCGSRKSDVSCSAIRRAQLRVESLRCFATYEQETWICGNGHFVTPEEEIETRDGLVWISRDTAYTEVFLFELLLNMTSSGTTLSSQSDVRSQILFLQTDYMSWQDAPRSTRCLRRALMLYAMETVRAIPAWVFRCNTCSSLSDGHVYYDKLSFDGQQLGFNIRKDVRYDFYGKPATQWRRPVDRCTKAWNTSHLIESKALRVIFMEALRVREVPSTSNSVHGMCRAMMNIPLRSKESIKAAIAAIKLFDSNW